MKAEPQPGILIVSPIEEPNEKHFIDIVGQRTNLTWAVIEKSGSSRPTHVVGALVCYQAARSQDVPLDKGVLFKLLFESDVLLTITPELAGEVKRKNLSPEQTKAFIDQRQQEVEAAQRVAALAAGTN